jgi:hypothetical protein
VHYAQTQEYYYEIKMAHTKNYIKKEKDISIMLNILMSYLIIRYISFFLLLTAWSRVLLEKLTGSAASQEIPRIFGTPRFITVFTSARHLSLS